MIRLETDTARAFKTRDMQAEVQGSAERLCRGGLEGHARPRECFLARGCDPPGEGLRLRACAMRPAASARVQMPWSKSAKRHELLFMEIPEHSFHLHPGFQTRPDRVSFQVDIRSKLTCDAIEVLRRHNARKSVT